MQFIKLKVMFLNFQYHFISFILKFKSFILYSKAFITNFKLTINCLNFNFYLDLNYFKFSISSSYLAFL